MAVSSWFHIAVLLLACLKLGCCLLKMPQGSGQIRSLMGGTRRREKCLVEIRGAIADDDETQHLADCGGYDGTKRKRVGPKFQGST